MTYLKKDAFFDAVAAEAGYLPREVIEKVFYALVRVTCRELRKGGMVRYPDFGDFTLRLQRARKTVRNFNGRRIPGFLGERKVMRFDADYKLRDYWRMLSGGQPYTYSSKRL